MGQQTDGELVFVCCFPSSCAYASLHVGLQLDADLDCEEPAACLSMFINALMCISIWACRWMWRWTAAWSRRTTWAPGPRVMRRTTAKGEC
jgi:hypothetical protein